MTLHYLFRCHICGNTKESSPLKLSLFDDEDGFVHDVSWEYLPEGWHFHAEFILCNECEWGKES